MERVKDDVIRFIPDRKKIAIWSPAYFHDLAANLKLDAKEVKL